MRNIFKSLIIAILTLQARILLARMKPKVAMVTGSIGKTSTKDAVHTALSAKVSVRKSEKSLNSEFGVPLTILGLKSAWENPWGWLYNIGLGSWRCLFTFSYPEWLVLEVGADHPGDLTALTRWVKPDMVVVTRFPAIAPHIEYYSSMEALIEEESHPAYALKEGGILILNDDDEKVVELREKVRGVKVVTYGTTTRADVVGRGDDIFYGSDVERAVPLGITFNVMAGDEEVPFVIHGALGVQQMYPILAGVAVATVFGVELKTLATRFADHKTPAGRMRIIEGLKGATIIDDSYNSSPTAAEYALLTLGRVKGGRHIAALGSMNELGGYSEEAHKELGKLAADHADFLLTVGDKARGIAEGALNTGMDESIIFQFEDSREAGKFLEGKLQEGDIVLVKGSQGGVRMEKMVEEIMAHPEDREKLLVRQEEGWRGR
jgi:UDP-N-acetylmuramoyl-tripeptide--D-alanyl-D-alanine ligase